MKRTEPAVPVAAPAAAEAAAEQAQEDQPDEELADCVLCGEPTEYPASTRGATLCPVCAWQEAQRTACSG
ncbi:hypothetical protein GA0115240_16642 [Streptomyces sp. DvalAA-14]|uniref:hypothetical protein n=1 Tax=unclassified Streptomyces TaxID=2593676 RepID=UPI00081AEF31|nr:MULTISPECIES: hypothetical protein [unclassified Streptomyces]MYS24618.1 hypothetical protein [Streptomyces sp. SID4948]SCE47785.1 hypothetical protein GA0115240_16642 [Streptomyces sp. DvalAA-14]